MKRSARKRRLCWKRTSAYLAIRCLWPVQDRARGVAGQGCQLIHRICGWTPAHEAVVPHRLGQTGGGAASACLRDFRLRKAGHRRLAHLPRRYLQACGFGSNGGWPMLQLMSIDDALHRLMASGGSDIVLSSGSQPRMRKDGKLEPLDRDAPVLTPHQTERIVREVLNSHQWEELGRRRHVDFAFTWREQARIRGNAYYQRGTLAVAFRLLPLGIPTFDQLGQIGRASCR